jgi:hypothetical protein
LDNKPEFVRLSLRARHMAGIEPDKRIASCWLQIAASYHALAKLPDSVTALLEIGAPYHAEPQ